MRDVYPTYEWINLSTILVQALSMMTLASFFLISLALLISIFIRDYTLQLVTILGIIGVSWFGIISTNFPPISQWIPLTYLNIMQILSGEFLIGHDYSLSYQQGMLVLGLWTLVIVVLLNLFIERTRGVTNK